jgi:hypothetical protein
MFPSGEPELALEIERGQHLAVEDPLADVGRELRDRVDHGVAEGLALASSQTRP